MNYRLVVTILLCLFLFSSSGLAYDPPVEYQLQQDQEFNFRLQVDLLALGRSPVQLTSWDQYYHLTENSPVPLEWGTKGVPVILIHGFQTSALNNQDYEEAVKLTFEELVAAIVQDERLTKNDLRIYGCTWPTKTVNLERSGQLLQQAINNTADLKYRDDLIIIGHSMGGLLARTYLEKYGGKHKVQKLITLATPHEGVPPLLLYNYTQSEILLTMFDLVAYNPTGLALRGLRDAFATWGFYQATNLKTERLVDSSRYLSLLSNPFLSRLNEEFPINSDQYRLVAGDIRGDETTRWGFKVIDQSYQGEVNDGLVAKYSALAGNQPGLVRKASHSGITEDDLVIDKLIAELARQIYYFDLPQRLVSSNGRLRVEVCKQVNGQEYVIDEFRLTKKDFGEDRFWSSKDQMTELTINGWEETVRLGLAGENIVKVYQEQEETPKLVFKLPN